MQERLNQVAKQLRKGELSQETVDLAKDAVEGLENFGRAFKDQDKQGLRKKMDELNLEKVKDPEQPNDLDKRYKGPEGNVRKKLTERKTTEFEQVRSRGEMKEDHLRSLIESGKTKVRPEYRKPLEEYYKAVAE